MAIKIFDAFGTIGIDGKKFTKDLGGALNSAKNFAKSMTSVLVKASAIAAGAITGIVGATTIAFAKLEGGVAEVVTLFGESGTVARRSIQQISNIVRDVSADFAQKLGPTVKATYDAISAGVPRQEIDEFLRSAARLAIGGVTEISTAVDILTTATNAFGLEANQAVDVSDKLFQGVRLGKTTITELAGAFGRVAPLARAANVSMSEVIGGLASLTARGLDTNEAVTALRGLIQQIIKPTDDAAKRAAALGIELSADAIAAKGLVGVLDDIISSTGGSADQIARLIPEISGMTAALSLGSDGGALFATNIREIENAAGSTQQAVDVMTDTIGFAFKQLRSTVVALGTEIGEIFGPAAKELGFALVDFFQDMRDLIRENQPQLQRIGETFAFIADKILELLIPNLDKAGGLFQSVIDTVENLADRLADFLSDNEDEFKRWKDSVEGSVFGFLDEAFIKFRDWFGRKISPILDQFALEMKFIFDEALNGENGWIETLAAATTSIAFVLGNVLVTAGEDALNALRQVFAGEENKRSFAEIFSDIGIRAMDGFIDALMLRFRGRRQFLEALIAFEFRNLVDRALAGITAGAFGAIFPGSGSAGQFVGQEIVAPGLRSGGARDFGNAPAQNVSNDNRTMLGDGAIRIDAKDRTSQEMEDIFANVFLRLQRSNRLDVGVQGAVGA